MLIVTKCGDAYDFGNGGPAFGLCVCRIQAEAVWAVCLVLSESEKDRSKFYKIQVSKDFVTEAAAAAEITRILDAYAAGATVIRVN